MLCGLTTTGKMFFYANSDMLVGAAWDIANNVQTGVTAITDTTTFHHYAVSYDGTSYRGFIDGVLQWTVTSAIKVSPRATRINFGNFQGNADYITAGYFDEIRVSPFARYTAAFTPAVAPFTPNDMAHDVFFEATNKMQTWPQGTEVNRCYVGEAVTNATAVTSTVCYKTRDAIDVSSRTMSSGKVVKAWANGNGGNTPGINRSEGVLSIARPSAYWYEVRFETPAKDIYYDVVFDSWPRLNPLTNGDYSSWELRTYRKRRNGFDFALLTTDGNNQLVQKNPDGGIWGFTVYERED
ncbi:LamG domain-containing protein [Neorhizobium galegae]|uniref:LamG domain-containing protein n=1 Tax=Neorhizobium galegae TaxID=399 RepID=UPI002104BD27|nr:LamG domain-containing protein [Neorhizobium galegae]